MGKRKALVTGITGQDGSYLAELLLAKDYQVTGLVRRSSVDTTERIRDLLDNPDLRLIEGDISDAPCMYRLIASLKPHEVYNLAAMSHVGASFDQPAATFDIDALGPLNLLEAIRQESTQTRFYQASTSELFGDTKESPQSEQTRLHPCSPYAVAKATAHHSVQLYRDAYGIYACAGILFNHESPRRGENFVTRKITKYVARLVASLPTGQPFPKLGLGNLDARRDWGHARDYVRAMYLMLQQDKPDDFVIATGETRTVRRFCMCAFAAVGLPWDLFVTVDPRFCRPADVNLLCGDASKARRVLGWEPTITFNELVSEMVEHDLAEQGLEIDHARQICARWQEGAVCHAS
jgi:GDPmannose 4,6-dehydratase